MRVVLLGPPGAGKGTQAEIIAGKLGVPAISTGDIFRANVSNGTDLGRRAKAFMDAGDLVPDEITVAMVVGRLAETDAADGFLLDGFPRTIPQAERLDEALADQGHRLDSVLELVVDEDEVVRRLSGRRMLLNGQWVMRDDDRPETVRRRLAVYRESTAPLSAWYAEAGLLRRIDAMGEIPEVTDRALVLLPTTQPSHQMNGADRRAFMLPPIERAAPVVTCIQGQHDAGAPFSLRRSGCGCGEPLRRTRPVQPSPLTGA